MSKIGIGILILATLGLGYWLSVWSDSKPAKEENVPKINLYGESQKEKETPPKNEMKIPENINTQNSTGELKQNIISNNEENIKYMNATLHTNKGDITIQFNPNTLNTVANFIKLAESGFYDGTKFHRVMKGFMSQGGDPLSKDDSKKEYWGTGGPDYKFDDEIKEDNSNDLGTISMANAGPNTNGSQFFINAADNNFLDTKHTVFGKVIAGLDVAEAINSVEVDSNDRPLEPVVLESITLK